MKADLCKGSSGLAIIGPDDMDKLVDDMNAVDWSALAAAEGLSSLEKEEVVKFRRWMTDTLMRQSSTGGSSTFAAGDMTVAYINATTKPCPKCKYQATHFHGHSCHHTLEGCPSCHVQYCYKCLATEEENVSLRGSRPRCLCGGWSNFCKSSDIAANIIMKPYPRDQVINKL